MCTELHFYMRQHVCMSSPRSVNQGRFNCLIYLLQRRSLSSSCCCCSRLFSHSESKTIEYPQQFRFNTPSNRFHPICPFFASHEWSFRTLKFIGVDLTIMVELWITSSRNGLLLFQNDPEDIQCLWVGLFGNLYSQQCLKSVEYKFRIYCRIFLTRELVHGMFYDLQIIGAESFEVKELCALQIHSGQQEMS